MPRNGLLGTLSVGGSPGRYTLRVGLTGRTIAQGTAEEILRGLAGVLRADEDLTVTVDVRGEENQR